MTKYNFDEIIDRKNTNSLKWDYHKERGMPTDLLPLWVADMEFRTPNEIINALKEKAEHGIFGYSEPYDDYYDVIRAWINKRYGYDVDVNNFAMTPSVVFGICNLIDIATKEGDGVIINEPVYYPFMDAITMNKRKLVINNLAYNDNKYTIDYEDFEKKIIDNNVKLYILCNPHNPVGRVWKKDELERLAEICYKHNVFVISDEIHADFIYPGNKFISYGSLDKKYLDNSAICISVSKTFNLAGLHNANVYFPSKSIKRKFIYNQNSKGYSQSNIMGIVASYYGYKYGEEWLNQLNSYLYGNLLYAKDFFNDKIPNVKLVEPEGTYLIWLDFSKLGISDKKLNEIIINKAKLWLDQGNIFGKVGECFERINIACPLAILKDALNRLYKALDEEGLL